MAHKDQTDVNKLLNSCLGAAYSIMAILLRVAITRDHHTDTGTWRNSDGDEMAKKHGVAYKHVLSASDLVSTLEAVGVEELQSRRDLS
jgi:hypothetical protein